MEQENITTLSFGKDEEFDQALIDEDLTKLCTGRSQESEELIKETPLLKYEGSDENTSPCDNIGSINIDKNSNTSSPDSSEKMKPEVKDDIKQKPSILEIDQMKLSNKKNVVKNIMNAFKNFILDSELKNPPKMNQAIVQHYNQAKGKEASDDLVLIVKKFKRYINAKNFNHYSMRLLILHPNYGPVLHYFLKGPILDWATNCKANDLVSHFAMVDFLLLSFEDISIIDELKRHEKKKAHYQ